MFIKLADFEAASLLFNGFQDSLRSDLCDVTTVSLRRCINQIRCLGGNRRFANSLCSVCTHSQPFVFHNSRSSHLRRTKSLADERCSKTHEANTGGSRLFGIHTQFSIFSKNGQRLVDKHSSQPTANGAFIKKLWWVARSCPPAVFESILCASNAAKNATCQ